MYRPSKNKKQEKRPLIKCPVCNKNYAHVHIEGGMPYYIKRDVCFACITEEEKGFYQTLNPKGYEHFVYLEEVFKSNPEQYDRDFANRVLYPETYKKLTLKKNITFCILFILV